VMALLRRTVSSHRVLYISPSLDLWYFVFFSFPPHRLLYWRRQHGEWMHDERFASCTSRYKYSGRQANGRGHALHVSGERFMLMLDGDNRGLRHTSRS